MEGSSLREPPTLLCGTSLAFGYRRCLGDRRDDRLSDETC